MPPLHPYENKPDRSFWRKSVANRHYLDLSELWVPPLITRQHKIATAGSCFAQHIGRHLRKRGAHFLNLEPTPPLFNGDEDAARAFGYGLYSCRYGNIYTTRQLRQLVDEALGKRIPIDPIWEKNGRYYDALRPSVDPVGLTHADDVLTMRNQHLDRVRQMLREMDVFIFTLGLTEGWIDVRDQTMYSVAPGTVAGVYDPEKHHLCNLTVQDIVSDIKEVVSSIRQFNPDFKLLLTVSPVPLAATATEHHVLVATTYSKAVLRASAGELESTLPGVHYFPSYEIISSHPARGMYFNPDLRTVNDAGVDFVMSNFFSGVLANEFTSKHPSVQNSGFDLICDESRLDKE